MYLGALVEIGPADEVYFDPWHPYTQALVASNPEPDPRSERERATAKLGGEIASPIDIGPGCRFAGRCPQVMEHCRTVTPRLETVVHDGKQRQVACHLYDPAGSAGHAPGGAR
jgi:oligopeptide/dipeptide ABC transporter ATP-binding protein